jgi:hypothetical protein
VTQRKETEPSSSSVFNQNDPWTPTVDFADFINNETIAGKVSCVWEMRELWGTQRSAPPSLGWGLETL